MKKLNAKLDNKYVGAITERQNGITLIALVITIIVLIILAGVAINLTLGENGIFTRAETAKLKYEIGKAEEELDIKIAELQVEKQGRATLQDVVDMLKAEEDMDYIVSLEEIATITGVDTIGDVDEIYVVYKIYQFRVDNKLQTEFISIVESYTADVQISSTLKSHDGKSEDEKYLATMEIKVESEGQVQSIEIETVDGKVTETPTSLPYTKEIQVEIGQKYIIKVTTPDGKYKRYVIEENAEETITNATELAAFRDKVNSGLTYEGKTVKLANDIDLSRVCYKVDGTTTNDVSWEPIGNLDKPFKGTFDGQSNKISDIYINVAGNTNGLFGYINSGKIKKLILNEGEIGLGVISGGICARADNSTISKCLSNVTVNGDRNQTGGIIGRADNTNIEYCVNLGKIEGTHSTGGICALLSRKSKIVYSFNKGEISCRTTGSQNSNYLVGGIVAYTNNLSGETTTIENCYNTGNITGKNSSSGANWSGGIVAVHQGPGIHNVSNCYSTGSISGYYKYGISGQASTYGGTAIVKLSNNYWLAGCGASSGSASSGNTNAQSVENFATLQTYATRLGEEYVDDMEILDEDGNGTGEYKYNSGLPILKWQVEE